jgi:predicted DNA-binding transcriptional regulator YafY
MLETSARLLRLLSLLQSRRGWTGPELAERLGVTARTVRNDVDRLRRLGYPVDATPGVAGGYRLGTGAAVPPLLLDDDEAVAVAVGLRTAAGGSVAGIEETSVRALIKLEQLLPPPLRRRIQALEASIVSTPSAEPRIDPQVLTVIAAACRDHHRVRFDYLRHDGTGSRRDVEPHRMVHAGRRWYLVAWDADRQDWRTFRVDRMDIPTNHAGPRFTPRTLSDGDVADRVARGVGTAMWRYHATITAHLPAEALAARLPPALTVHPVDERSCRVDVGSDTPQLLAIHLGMLDVDFDIDDADRHPELVEHLRRLSERFQRAVGPESPGRSS